MSNRFRIALILSVAVASVQLLGAASGDPPITSGYIEQLRTGFDAKKQAVGDRRAERIWFSGRSTRTDELIDDHLSTSSVRGDQTWTAYPEAGRIFEVKSENGIPETYPEEVRRTYARIFKQRKRGGETTVGEYPAWKYAWHEPARTLGDIGSTAEDLTYLVHASENFPLILESTADHDGGSGSRQSLTSFKLGDAVPNRVFDKPKDLKPVVSFQLSQRIFRLDVEKERISTRYGWKVRQFDSYAGDGKLVAFTHRQDLTDANGVVSTTSAPPQTLDYQGALQQLGRELQVPTWSTVKRTGRERVLGLDADVLENYVQGLPNATYTVVDHPQLGTFTARHSYTDENERGSTSVKALRIEAPPRS